LLVFVALTCLAGCGADPGVPDAPPECPANQFPAAAPSNAYQRETLEELNCAARGPGEAWCCPLEAPADDASPVKVTP